jgi:hypothetical protein
MAKIQIARDVLDRARDRSVLTDAERAVVECLVGERGGKGAVTAALGDYPLPFLKALLDDAAEALWTREAKAALHRLARRSAKP